MAGYSGRPLHAKLGLKSGQRIALLDPPCDYVDLLGEGAPVLSFEKTVLPDADMTHLFTRSRATLAAQLPLVLAATARNGMIWVSWPKKASKVPTDVTEDVIREVALPMGLVDVKVCAVSDVWSGLKLMIRKELR